MYRDETKNLVEFPYKRVTITGTLGKATLTEDQIYTQEFTLNGYTFSTLYDAYTSGLPVILRYKPNTLISFDYQETVSLSVNITMLYLVGGTTVYRIYGLPDSNILTVEASQTSYGLRELSILCWIPS